MENKCNKTPNNNNSKYIDHVYCHTSESKTYIRANHNNAASGATGGGGAASANADFMALLKENKQLKAMLILHLDLIQEQSDQLMNKDKLLVSQNEKINVLSERKEQLEKQVVELQKQLQRQLKRTAPGNSSIPPPPLAKIQCTKKETSTSAGGGGGGGTPNIIGEFNGKLISKIILHRVNMPGQSPHSISTTSDTCSDMDDANSKLQHDEEEAEEEEEETEEAGNTTEDSSDGTLLQTAQRLRRQAVETSKLVSRGAKPRPTLHTTLAAKTNSASATAMNAQPAAGAAVQVCVTPPTPSRGKQMPLMLWHAPNMHSEESASCDSMADTEQRSTSAASPASTKRSKASKKKIRNNAAAATSTHGPMHRAKSRRFVYVSTPQMYCTREWEDEEFICDYEFDKEEANALHADAPMLEIPKWTEHDLNVSYNIEGTEDLSDDTFLKRHAKLEVDEKRRKKWDVQQIREQRRIEKLKRRHCKDEIQTPAEQQTLASFYPSADSVQTICFIDDLPVQAFGEVIPKVNTHADFALPWLETTTLLTGPQQAANTNMTVTTLTQANTSTTSAQAQQQQLHSSFAFLKKRRRQLSYSTGAQAPTARQRSVAAAKATTMALTVAGAGSNANNTTEATTK